MPEAEAITIDPEVEEILRAIASDSSSGLLRVSRPKLVRGLFSRKSNVSEVVAGITTAERHLIRSARSDVALLLLEACRRKLLAGQTPSYRVSPFHGVRHQHRRWRSEGWIERLGKSQLERSHQMEATPWLLLEQCVRDPLGLKPSILELAEASIRLEPTDEARIITALDMIGRGQFRASIRYLLLLLAAPMSTEIAVCVWNNLGMAHSSLGEFNRAHECYVVACRVERERPEPWMNRLVAGIQLGIIEDVRYTCRAMDDMPWIVEDTVRTFIRSKRLQRTEGRWYPSAQSGHLVRDIELSGGPVARSITSVFN